MFVGHYGPAAAVAGKRIKLWHGFVAVQFLDILWAPFVLLGIEKLRIVDHFTKANHLDLYHMPYTHSLVMAVFWSVLAGWLYSLWRKGGGVVIGGLVFSHWILDFLTHRPDLELWFGGPKVGLGLWDHLSLSLGLELLLLGLGFAVYFSQTSARGVMGSVLPVITVSLLLAAQVFGNFGPPPPSPQAAAMTAIAAYLLFGGLAALIDATRQPRN